MKFLLHILATICILQNLARAQASFEEEQDTSLPLWEYGVGVGAVRFWHYPASDQSRDWVLPFPTFQYRGEILRADDREGARAYLLRETNWSLEMSGGGLPALRSQDDHARLGMPDLPWRFQLGPQLVSHYDSPLQIKLGVYQVVSTLDWKSFAGRGQISQLDLYWHFGEELQKSGFFGQRKIRAHLGLSAMAATEEFHQLYFGVSALDATAERPAYNAKAGFLSYSISYFQAISLQKWNVYFGGEQEFFDRSVNRDSPLHRSDRNLNLFAGVTFTLGESEQRSIPESKAQGAFEKIRQHRLKIER